MTEREPTIEEKAINGLTAVIAALLVQMGGRAEVEINPDELPSYVVSQTGDKFVLEIKESE